MKLTSGTDGLIWAVRSTDWTDKTSYWRVASKLYYLLADRQNLLNLQWDFLFVLDAARFDMFVEAVAEVSPDLAGETKQIVSVGSTTREWGRETFSNRDLTGYGYLTANPMYNHFGIDDLSDRFGVLVDATEVHDEVFSTYGTVPPRIMSETVLDQIANRPDLQWIFHYLQPHQPFVSPYDDNDEFPTYPHMEGHETAWVSLERGDVSEQAVREAYYGNHRLAVEEVLWLLGELPEGSTAIISSDHGNVFGKWHGFYGHGEGMYLPGLVNVPMLKVPTGKSYSCRPPELDIEGPEEAVGSSVSEQLEALGYTD